MATVINARDLLLQAVSPRVEQVTMADNITVDPDQVEGLGLIISGTRSIRLSADTQVFQIAKDGTVTPTSVTLSVVKTNLTNSPTLSIMSGSVTPTPSFTGDNVTIDYDDFDTDTVTFRATVTDGADAFTDDITVIKVREGEDSLNAFLSNEAHTLPADSSGNVTSYTGCSGQFRVFRGTYEVTSACTFGLAVGGNPDGLVYSINTFGAYSVTGGMLASTSTTTLTLTATFAGTILAKVFTITKSRAGSDGTDGVNGADGVDGVNGTSIIWQGTFATHPSSPQDGWAYRNSTDGKSYTYQSGFWYQMTIDGVDGADGVDGISIVWKGESATPPSSPEVNWVYKDTDNGLTYIYTGLSWELMVQDGTNGADGFSVTVEYSTNGTSWHDDYVAGDKYLRQSVDGGATWTDAILFVGSDGADGTDGQRGSMTFYVPIAGTTYDSSLATTTASVYGGPILNDVVTQYNSGAGFSETRFWDGTSWVVVNAVVDGNLLVTGTVGANKLAANSVTAEKIDVTNLNAVTADTGDLTVDGDITISTGGKIVSSDYVADTSGMVLNPTGTSEFNDVRIRGHVEATSGEFSGDLNVKSATTGARVEILTSGLRIYDSSNVLRIRIGERP